ncbi:aromatic ring-opening dioxygenase LigA [Antribacter gilvus]|uniref:aromatic ring-opening dioxygenase LigA n=1 Tax=Antribacter gilvus TaxID=2304675 RepID=UPI000F7ACDD4|nr:aromatic ring-opening dioxygenase LigA [Antribacter gilvus]
MNPPLNARDRGFQAAAVFTIVAGVVMALIGIAAWGLVSSQLSAEGITVHEDSTMMGGALVGDPVRDPFTAYAQAEVIAGHAMEASGGKTYAELDREDPARNTVQTAAFLRASLFTSVISFGICALVIGLGILFVVVGGALRRVSAVDPGAEEVREKSLASV